MSQRRRIKPREKKSVRIFKRTLTVVLSVCLVLIVAFGVVYNLAISQSAAEPYRNTKPSLDIVSQGIEAVSLGKEVFLSNEQVNNSIAYLLEKSGQKGKNPCVTGFYLTAEETPQRVAYCVTLVYNKRLWVLSGNGAVTFETSGENAYLVFTVDRLAVGKLPLPKRMALRFLAGKLEDNAAVTVDGDRIRFAVNQLPVQITGFRAADGGFYVTANNLVDMLLGAISPDGGEQLQASVKDALQQITDKMAQTVSEEDRQRLADLERELVEGYLELKDAGKDADLEKIAQDLQSSVTGLLDGAGVDLGQVKEGIDSFISGLLHPAA